MQKYEHLKDIPLLSTIIVILLGVWGAILNYAKRETEIRKYSKGRKVILFIIDLLTSAGFSLLTFYGLVGYGINEPISIALAGISAYQGTRLMYLVELYIATKYGNKAVIDAIHKENKEK